MVASKLSIISLLIILTVFFIGVFKNIQYPLFWNDEGETVMFAERVLQFGYPKVHDGKNTLNPTEQQNKGLGVKEKNDAWLPVGWVQYYYAAPMVFLSHFFEDFYTKTAIVRIAFATIGITGVILFSYIGYRLQKGKQNVFFLIFFFTLEVFSVFLYLHLRTVRLHVLSIFFMSICSYLFIYGFCKKRDAFYLVAFTISLFFLYLNFSPSYIAFILTMVIYGLFEKSLKYRKLVLQRYAGLNMKKFLPVIASLLMVIPVYFYFETGAILSEVSKGYVFGSSLYFHNIIRILSFLIRYDYLGLFIIVKVIFAFVILKRYTRDKFLESRKVRISSFFTFFLLIYILLISRTPYIFERYLVILQPILVLVIFLDLFYIFNILKKDMKLLVYYLIPTLFLASLMLRLDTIKGYINEIVYPYRGVLDYAIFYIDDNFINTKNMVIATNYEEYSYMYYLNSKVTVGFVGNNLEEDKNIQPDIVIMRKGRPNNVEVLESFLEKEEYSKIAFPIFDYQFNNIPEITLPINHLFMTKTGKDNERLEIFINENTK